LPHRSGQGGFSDRRSVLHVNLIDVAVAGWIKLGRNGTGAIVTTIVDVTYCIPSTPLICRSITLETVSSTVWASAPIETLVHLNQGQFLGGC